MRPLKQTNIHDIEVDDMIAFQRVNKDGKTVSLLGLVSRVKFSEDKTEIENFEVHPMVPSAEAPTLDDVKIHKIYEEQDLFCTGLDVMHTVYGMSFRLSPTDIASDTIPKLGYMHPKVANEIYDFLNKAEEANPAFFNLHPDIVAGIGFPPMRAEISRKAIKADLKGQPQPHKTGGGIYAEWKKTRGYDYPTIDADEEQPEIIGNPWEDFDFK